MSASPDNEFDLEKLFLPAWAQEPSTAKNYENYKGEEAPSRRREAPFGQRPPRRDRPAGPGRAGQGGQPRGDRPQGRGSEQRREGRPQGRPGEHRGRGERFQGRPQERREPPPPLPEINVTLVPDEKGVESLARQIKMTGRAYPLFDIAQMILQKPERHSVTFSVKKGAEGQVLQSLFLCALDETLWLSEDEAINHVLKKHFTTFYQAEKTPTEPPKGRYTFVAQCGLSGVILGPPNHHDYQNQLRKLHAERFSRMPFDMYKSRVRIVSDEEVVKKWVEDQSWKTEYICLNLPESLKLTSMDAVEKHFRETHKEAIIKPVESYTLSGTAARNLRCAPLTRALRVAWEEQRRFPLKIATTLSQQFASRGLQFFKVNKTLTHVSVARPHYLDMEATPVSEGVRRIVDYLNSHTKTTRRQLMEALLPAAALKLVPRPPIVQQQAPSEAPTEAPAGAEPAATQPSPTEQAAGQAQAPVETQPSPEQTALIADLHWLIHQGHVIEFANGTIETAKKPTPKPPKPEKKPAAPAEAAAAPQPESGVTAEPGPGTPVAPSDSPTEAASAEVTPTPAEPAAEQTEQQFAAPAPAESAPESAAEIAPAPAPEQPQDASAAPAPEKPPGVQGVTGS